MNANPKIIEEEIPYKVSKRKKILRWVIPIVFIYCGTGLVLFYFQEKLMFHPEPLPRDYIFPFDRPFKEVFIPINSRDTLHLVQFFPTDTGENKGVVLYFHGNRDNVIRYEKYVGTFTKQGYEVWMPDYPGYGKSTGAITEKLINIEAEAVYKLARTHFGEDSIIVYGKSLGTGPASLIASEFKCHRLILETPYFSFPSLFSSYAPIYPTQRMTRFKFPVGKYLEKVKAPITIFHGTDDKVVFYSNASKLKALLKPGDQFITIEKGGHNDLNDFPVFKEKLDSLLKK